MPLLSLPLPAFPFFNYHLIPAYFPLRVHLPIGKIPSIIPTNSFKEGMLALFEIAWKNKVRLPVLITVCFLAFDIRLQLEINIFWEEPQPNRHNRQREATAVIIQRRQRQRVFHERADQIRRELEDLMREATEVRLRNRMADQDGATISGEQTSTSDENGQGLGKEGSVSKRREKRRRLRKKYKSTSQSKSEDEEDSSEDENTTDSDENDEDSDLTTSDEDDDDDNDDNGAGDGPGFFNADDFDDDDQSLSDSDIDDDDDDSDSGTPLVVELEIRQRPGLKVLTDKLCLVMQNSLNVFEIFKQEIIEGVP